MSTSLDALDDQWSVVEDPRLSLESLVELSSSSLFPILQHLVQGNLLMPWCRYVVDSTVLQLYGWKQPEVRHLYWWLDTESEDNVSSWLNQGCRGLSVSWHMAVATAYFSAANAWFANDLEDRYISRRHAHEKVHCRLIDCGANHGLALDLSIAIELNPDELDHTLTSLGDQLRVSTEVIPLADIRSGIPQILAGSPPGEWLPPFHNGNSWIILQVTRHERPTLEQLAPRLLLEDIKAWRKHCYQQLTTHWLQVFSACQANP